MDESHAYVVCEMCSKQILVELTVQIGDEWIFDPEDLPDGWMYTVELYPSQHNYIYCPEHTGAIKPTLDGSETKEMWSIK